MHKKDITSIINTYGALWDYVLPFLFLCKESKTVDSKGRALMVINTYSLNHDGIISTVYKNGSVAAMNYLDDEVEKIYKSKYNWSDERVSLSYITLADLERHSAMNAYKEYSQYVEGNKRISAYRVDELKKKFKNWLDKK